MSHGHNVTTQVSTGSNVFVQGLLNDGYRWDTSSETGHSNWIRTSFVGSGFDPGPANQIGIAMGRWVAVANITFVEVVAEDPNDPSLAESVEMLFHLEPRGTLGGAGGYSGGPFDALTENNVFTNNGQSIHVADLGRTYTRISSAATNNDQDCFDSSGNLTPAGFELVMHEVGHALGLKHPHDAGTANYQHYFPGVTPNQPYDIGDNALNQKLWTIMSYNKETIGYNAATPMAFDIAAIQTLYGARTDARSGNDTYIIPTPGTDTAWRCIWDTGGTDSIRYDGTYTNIIDLRPASLQNEYGGGGWVSFSNTGNTIGCGFTIAGDITNAIADRNGVTGVIIENAYGGSGYDGITGNDVDNIIDGGAGGDYMAGLGGNDTYYVDNTGDRVIEAAGGGTNDRVDTKLTTYTLGANLEFLNFDGPSSTGFTGTGNELDNTIQGYFGADILDGKAGADTMRGYSGDDTYYVDNVGDVVSDSSGYDRVNTTLTRYTLGAGIEVLDYQGPSTTAFRGTGNELNNTIQGYGGNDILDGKAGADLMRGYGGDDTFYVDNVGDIVEDFSGTTTILASIDLTLAAGQAVAVLGTTKVTGTASIDLTGNALAQRIDGNDGANVLNGGGGVDALKGHGGSDRFYVDNAADTVVEAIGGGSDYVLASVSYSLKSGVEVERLSTTSTGGSTAMNLTGNEFSQRIDGNEGGNKLNALGGDDTLNGYGGNDVLYGGIGNDTLVGGLGNDAFQFDSKPSVSTNIDAITDFANVSGNNDTIRMENALYTKLVGTGTLTDNQFKANATGTATDADDRIIYETDTGKLFYDANGNAAGGTIQFAVITNFASLTGTQALSASDFLVV